MSDTNQHFFVSLKAFITKGDKLLIVRESDKYKSGNAWELPGGRIKPGELHTPLREILQREIAEELGGTFFITVGDIVHAWQRPTHPDGPEFLVGFEYTYKSGEITVSEEHTGATWIGEGDMGKYTFADGFEEAIREFFHKR